MPVTIGAEDTIFAPATPPGASPRGILRISGPQAVCAVRRICADEAGEPLPSPGAVWRREEGTLSLPAGGSERPEPLALPAAVYAMPAPQSYTREDVVELHLCGAGPLMRIVGECLARNGLRHANAGEFTLRAFLNGRLDLARAEAVAALIHARDETDRASAIAGVEGRFTGRLGRWRERLVSLAGEIEARLDFEEDEVGALSESALDATLAELRAELEAIRAASARRGSVGGAVTVQLAGLTNAGKSSLVNALCPGADALEAEEAGTTRDWVEHPLVLDGVRFLLRDTPGEDVSASDDALRQAASARRECAGPVMARLRVIDASAAPRSTDGKPGEGLGTQDGLVLLNKCDLPVHPAWEAVERTAGLSVLRVSARTGEGIERVKEALIRCADADVARPQSSFTDRVKRELDAAATHIAAAQEVLRRDIGTELLAEEVRLAHAACERVEGRGYAEDVLEQVFSRFCIGK
jgi:tRNA modification GTPase